MNPCFARNILLNYAVENPHFGYTQGMSDLLAPVLAEIQNEVHSHTDVSLENNGQFPYCQSWSFLTVHGQLSILIQWIRVLIVRWQSNLVNTEESVLPVCDKPYHTNKKKCTEKRGDRSFAELCLVLLNQLTVCSLWLISSIKQWGLIINFAFI